MGTMPLFMPMMGMKMKKEKGADGKEVTKETLLYTPMDIMKLPEGKQLVIIQGHYNRPIEADQERWFKNTSKVEKELYNKIQMGEAPPLPEFLVASHHRALGYTGTPRIYYPATKEIKILSK